jgi:autotransporter translocation and assembly factor TamB
LHLNWAAPNLFVRSAFLSLGQPRNLSVTGQFEFGEHGSMQLHLSAKHMPAEPFVVGYWKGRFDGALDSETDLKKQSEADAKVTASGELSFSGARIHDVETLKKVAVVTRHSEFEKPRIDILKFNYSWTGKRLEISKLEAETKGLCRLEGQFSLEDKNIDGHFKLGAAPDVVDAIPGAREKVFTEARSGYLWTSVNVSGPTSHPHEDLKQRLVDAAKEHFASGFLAPILKPGKGVIDLLQDLDK